MAQAPTPKPRNAATPKRPPHLPHGRWLGDLRKQKKLSAAEEALVKACGEGRPWHPTDWNGESRPEESTPANTIRGELIRFLVLGGDALHPVHELSVMVLGAWISGTLDLHQARAAVRLALSYCHFETEPIFMAARFPELVMSGSAVPGINADGLTVTGSVYLREGFETTGSVRLPGAQIGGDLDCTKGKFHNEGGFALNADRMTVTGSVFLSEGFEATGSVRLLGAQIGGDLTCAKGKFHNEGGYALNADRINVTGSAFLNEGFEATGSVRLLGAQIGGSLACTKGKFSNDGEDALHLQGINVAGAVLLRASKLDGIIKLSAAKLGTLIDDADCWASGGHILDGLQYDRIIGPTDATSRIAWLKSQRADHITTDFAPQPWEQLIKVLREMGHPFEAGEVAIAKQEQLRAAGVIKGPVRKGMHWLYGKMAGYGHRPIRTVGWMIWVWLVCAFFFQIGGTYGYVGPNTPLISNAQQAAQIDAACGHRREDGKQVWTECSAMPAEYTTFQPLAYSADLILPLVNLQQEEDWAPIVSEPKGGDMRFGIFLRWLMWFEILFGWAASLMLVAVLGRLVEKD